MLPSIPSRAKDSDPTLVKSESKALEAAGVDAGLLVSDGLHAAVVVEAVVVVAAGVDTGLVSDGLHAVAAAGVEAGLVSDGLHAVVVDEAVVVEAAGVDTGLLFSDGLHAVVVDAAGVDAGLLVSDGLHAVVSTGVVVVASLSSPAALGPAGYASVVREGLPASLAPLAAGSCLPQACSLTAGSAPVFTKAVPTALAALAPAEIPDPTLVKSGTPALAPLEEAPDPTLGKSGAPPAEIPDPTFVKSGTPDPFSDRVVVLRSAREGRGWHTSWASALERA